MTAANRADKRLVKNILPPNYQNSQRVKWLNKNHALIVLVKFPDPFRRECRLHIRAIPVGRFEFATAQAFYGGSVQILEAARFQHCRANQFSICANHELHSDRPLFFS
jgi:hypothetical protein